jgi:hypothetical protein
MNHIIRGHLARDYDTLTQHVMAVHRSPEWRAMREPVAGFHPKYGPGIAPRGQWDGSSDPVLLQGSAPMGLFRSLAQTVSANGYFIEFGPSDNEEQGYTYYPTRTIHLTDGMSDAQTAATLAHESAHMLLHCNQATMHGQMERLQRAACEVEAELTAHLVLGAHGMDTSPFTVPYVADWSAPVWNDRNIGGGCEHAPTLFAGVKNRVLTAAQVLLDGASDMAMAA